VDCYEFDVPEADFVAWAKGNGWPLQTITDERHWTREIPHASPSFIYIQRGLFSEWVNPQRADDRLDVMYDSDTRRAYYKRSFR
jgi:hypothetical protein